MTNKYAISNTPKISPPPPPVENIHMLPVLAVLKCPFDRPRFCSDMKGNDWEVPQLCRVPGHLIPQPWHVERVPGSIIFLTSIPINSTQPIVSDPRCGFRFVSTISELSQNIPGMFVLGRAFLVIWKLCMHICWCAIYWRKQTMCTSGQNPRKCSSQWSSCMFVEARVKPLKTEIGSHVTSLPPPQIPNASILFLLNSNPPPAPGTLPMLNPTAQSLGT